MFGACYIRVSTEEQTEFSPDAQLRVLKEYAKKNDIVLSKNHIYIDEGISGKTAEKRPAFMQMIATAKSKPKPFDVILVHKFDRFARSREDSVVYKSLLKKEAGIKVVSITESIEDDKFSVILEAMLEAMAEYYSLNLAEEVKKGMTEKALKGGYQTTEPFGYKLIDKKLVIEPQEAEYIRFMFTKFAEKQMGLRAIAVYLNDLGIKTKRGNPFENRTVEYIFNNPVYVGNVRWTPTGKTRRNYNNPDSIIAKGEHEAIIEIELWERVQEALKLQKELYPKNAKTHARLSTWLKGLVRCGSCGGTIVNGARGYMQCSAFARGACKVSHHIKTTVLENLILGQLKETLQSQLDVVIVPKTQDVTTSSELELLHERLKKLDLREQRIKEAYQDGIDTKEEYKENKQKLKAERQSIQNQLDGIQTQLLNNGEQGETIHKQIENVFTLLTDESVDLEIKYKTVHFLISKIVFDKPAKSLYIEFK
ncbi:MAG: recombinase family protein [Oscillospiraceae bacterium]|nr:recombinase family protein [Oscillospiraceae bacterium]